MLPKNTLSGNLLLGFTVSVSVSWLVVMRVMEMWGDTLSFSTFITDATSVLFFLLMACLILSSWTVKGKNNRVLVLCWSVGLYANYAVYWLALDYFLNTSKNIYAINFLGTAAALPLVILCRYRVLLSLYTVGYLRTVPYFKNWGGPYLKALKSTDFEFSLRGALTFGLTVEFLYSVYLSAYALMHNIPYNGQLYAVLESNGDWDPYGAYMVGLNFSMVYFILVLTLCTYRDQFAPDAYLKDVSKEKKKLIAEIMISRRKNSAENRANKRKN